MSRPARPQPATQSRRPLQDEQSRRIIREELATNLLVEAGAGSGKTQMLAERMAAGIASGVYQIEHMAAVTFTRKAASELRGRFHLALEKRARSSSRRSASGRTRDAAAAASRCRARQPGALLRRHDPFLLRAPASRAARRIRRVSWLHRARRSAGRGAAQPRLARLHHQRASPRAIRDMLDLLETGVRPNDLDSAFATICGNEDVEFPPGDGRCPDPKPAWKALEKFWKELEKDLPADTARRYDVQHPESRARSSERNCASRGSRLDRPAVIADLARNLGLRVEDHSRSGGPTSTAEKKRFKDVDRATARGLLRGDRDALSVAVAAVCLPPVRHAAHARARPRAHASAVGATRSTTATC